MWWFVLIVLEQGGTERQIPGAHWSDSLTCSGSYRPVQKVRDSVFKKWTLPWLHALSWSITRSSQNVVKLDEIRSFVSAAWVGCASFCDIYCQSSKFAKRSDLCLHRKRLKFSFPTPITLEITAWMEMLRLYYVTRSNILYKLEVQSWCLVLTIAVVIHNKSTVSLVLCAPLSLSLSEWVNVSVYAHMCVRVRMHARAHTRTCMFGGAYYCGI